jgi:hypothetical protein
VILTNDILGRTRAGFLFLFQIFRFARGPLSPRRCPLWFAWCCLSGILGCVLVPGVAEAASRVIISEVMTSNRRTVLDEDRQLSDWIELFNAGDEVVDLKGWSLTDDPKQLTKWVFPESPLGIGDYLLVFASGKDRRQPGRELHTNFKLDTDGEYLALVQPDGRTISTQFKPKLPSLRPDVSYGIPLREEVHRLVQSDAVKWVRVPTGEVGTQWLEPAFDASSWSTGKGGVGFDSTTNLLPWLGADLGALMKGKSAAVLVRVPFSLSEADFSRLALRMFYDDGFVAWINGREVARRNAPESLTGNLAASRSRDTASSVDWSEGFEGEPQYVLMNGDPAGKARVSTSTPDTNRFLRLINGRLPEQLNGVAFPQTLTGAPAAVQLDFDFRIKGGGGNPNRLTLALIPVKDFGASGPGLPLKAFATGSDPEPQGATLVQLEIDPSGQNSHVYLYSPGGEKIDVPVREPSLGWRFYHRASLKIDYTAQGAAVTLKVLTDVRGGSGREAVIANRVPVPGLKPVPSRLQIVGHSRASLVTMDLENLQARWTPSADALSEDFDLTAWRSALRPGTNVLCVLGLNRAPADPDFLVLPELYAFSTQLRLDSPRYFSPASPLSANSDPGFGAVAPAPTVSPRGGAIRGNQSVKLASSLPGGVIRYTLDGREPTESSEVYSAPLEIGSGAVLKASVFAPGYLSSEAVLETYTQLEKDVEDFSSNLPILVLTSSRRPSSETQKTPVVARFIEPGQGRAQLKGAASLELRGDVNVRGFSSTRYPKKSFTFRLRDEYGEKAKVGLLGMPKDSDWVLLAPYPDKTLMRDVLAYDLSRAMGHYATRTRFVEVFLNQTGDSLSFRDYVGVYVLVEKIKRGKNRVDIQELGPSDNGDAEISGGYIFKRDHSNKESPTFTSRGGEFFMVEPDAEDISPQQREWIERHWRALERSIFGNQFLDPRKGYQHYLDVPSFIDQHWLIEMSKNIDGFRYSVYFSKDRGGKVKSAPVWDWNLSFGNANYLDGESPSGWYTEQLRDTEISWSRRLVADPEYNQKQLDRWWELRRTVFQPESIHRRIDEMAAQLQEAQARNFRRWSILGRHVHPNAFVGETYQEEINYMKEWVKDRIAWIDRQMPAPPSIQVKAENGETRAIVKGRGGKIFYTLDGSDPRQAGGEPSPSAKPYEAPIRLGSTAKLLVRVRTEDVMWGPLAVWEK